MARTSSAAATLAGVVAAEHARIMGAVIAAVGDWQLAEDAVQDAAARALETWDRDGIPANPAGWLVVTARRRGIDLRRRAATRDATAHEFAVLVERGLLSADPGPGIDDDRLRLICTCAHPALSLESRVALTLRTVLGLTPSDIASLLASSEAAIAKRLVRARSKITHAGIPYRVPAAEDLPERVDAVLAVVYLLFTTGYAGTAAAGPDAMTEAIRLARLLVALLAPADALETRGLLALLLLHDSRRAARLAADGTPIPMERQDRSQWDDAAIEEAQALLGSVLGSAAHHRTAIGRYTLQAAIALEHARPRAAGGVDWPRVVAFHDLLARVAPSPAQALARAVAVGRASGPADGVAALDAAIAAHPSLTTSHLTHAARADLLDRLGRSAAARRSYEHAALCAPTPGERAALRAAASVTGPHRVGPGGR